MKLREPLNGLTHFIGIFLAVIGLTLLLRRNALTIYHLVSFSIFGGAMILLYTGSTLYHWLPLSGKKLEIFRKIDHIMIFVFIAATYSPVCLVTLRGSWGWSIFGSVWGLAVGGFFLKIFWLKAPRWLSTLIYLFMGWLIIVGLWPLSKLMSTAGLLWMLAGGIFYSIGAVIYILKKPNLTKYIGFHEIFHILIMLGSFSHFWLIYRYV